MMMKCHTHSSLIWRDRAISCLRSYSSPSFRLLQSPIHLVSLSRYFYRQIVFDRGFKILSTHRLPPNIFVHHFPTVRSFHMGCPNLSLLLPCFRIHSLVQYNYIHLWSGIFSDCLLYLRRSRLKDRYNRYYCRPIESLEFVDHTFKCIVFQLNSKSSETSLWSEGAIACESTVWVLILQSSE